MRWQKIALIGVGLLGGSLGLAIKRRSLADKVTGYVRRPSSIEECQSRGVVDQATTTLEDAVADADLIILCSPIGQMRPLTDRLLPHIKANAVLTDVGSVKGCVVSELEPIVAAAGARFVGSHPMAGAEKTGVQAAQENLFDNAVCAITPTPSSDSEAVSQVAKFWSAVGAAPLQLSPELHDKLVGRCSHLPHILAAALVNEVFDPAHAPSQSQLCGPGFRDTTRIASGSPEMWRDICLANRHNLATLLDALIARLNHVKKALIENDGPRVENTLKEAKDLRDHWIGSEIANRKSQILDPGSRIPNDK